MGEEIGGVVFTPEQEAMTVGDLKNMGEEKIGYCAWHPTKGWFGHQPIISETAEYAWRRLVVHQECKHLMPDYDDIEAKLRKEGWIVKKVRMTEVSD